MQAGEAFAGRVAASLLVAVGLPELIVSTEQQYEERAVELASRPQLLEPIRARLAAERTTRSLFDSPRFTRHLESAYALIYDRHHAGHGLLPSTCQRIDVTWAWPWPMSMLDGQIFWP